MDVEQAWEEVLNHLTKFPKDEEIDYESQEGKYIINKGSILLQENCFPILNEWLIDDLNIQLATELTNSFWDIFKTKIKDNVIEVVHKAFGNLENIFFSGIVPFYRLKFLECQLKNEKYSKDKVKKMYFSITHPILNSILLFSTRNNYEQYIRLYLKESSEVFDKVQKKMSLVKLDSCKENESFSDSHLQDFVTFLKSLSEWKILAMIITEPFMDLLSEKIDFYIKSICEAPFEKSCINSIFEWVTMNIINYPENIFKKLLNSDFSVIKFEPCYVEKLKLHAVEVYGRVRINQLFDIIIEFPDSFLVLEDLVTCLKINPDLKQMLVSSLKGALQSRLLHQGVTTADILAAYISTMRALKLLDQSGVMLEVVGEPVKKYLKHRDDTVRSIVTSLTEECNDDLTRELSHKRLLTDDDDSGEESVDINNWHKWEPDPVEAEPLKTSQASRSFDIVSMLISIYGSKELFIDEYRTLLADRILTQMDYDMDREIRNLELLKLRFGENQLHQCEVMLKDVSDSRRINAQILENDQAQDNLSLVPIQSIILSGQFWPSRLRDDNVELPQCLLDSMNHFKKRFEVLKGNRTLVWKPHLGLVDLELELNGKVLSFVVSPVHATIVWHFQHKNKYTLDELSSLMQMPSQALHRKIIFWQRKGVLKEDGVDCYSLIEELNANPFEELNNKEETLESALISSKDQKEEKVQVIWSYVIGITSHWSACTAC